MATVAVKVNRIVRRAAAGSWEPAELDLPMWSLLDRSRPGIPSLPDRTLP
jgi:hypothetical protein